MAKPAVRELNSVITELSKSLDPKKALIDQDISANEQSGVAQMQGLDARKDEAFGQIEQGAQNKGMFFSGFSPDAQAKYTSSTYLPALAQLQQTIASTRGGLLGKKADLDLDVYKQAFSTRENDINAARQWDSDEENRRFQSEQSQRDAERRAQEAEKQRQFEASEGSKNRASQGASSGPKVSNQELFASELAKGAGKDGKVSPGNYNALKQQWVASGYGDYKSFHDKYWKFANDKHWWDYR